MYIITEDRTIVKNLMDGDFYIDEVESHQMYYHILDLEEYNELYTSYGFYHPNNKSYKEMVKFLEEKEEPLKEEIKVTLVINVTKDKEDIIKNIEYKLVFEYDGNNEQKAYDMQVELWDIKALSYKTANLLNTNQELLKVINTFYEFDDEYENTDNFIIEKNQHVTLCCMTAMLHDFFKMFTSINFEIIRINKDS